MVHRTLDNAMFKSMIKWNNKREIEQIIKNCHDDLLYDVVIYSRNEYENLGNIKIRYLNYGIYGDNIEITLKYPEDLVSATLFNVKISIMS